jgi:palmitoyl transferase
MRHILPSALLLLLVASVASASETESMSWTEKAKYNLSKTWNSGYYDLYVPLYAWHNRLTYDREHIDKYNENPWGAGIGTSRYDSDGDWHGLYAMAFKDSNSYLETMFGYAFMKNWTAGCEDEWRAGVGFTVGVTQRHEYSYIPVPLPLPLAGIGYKRLDLQAAYVPGVKNDGNVLFVWTKIRLN